MTARVWKTINVGLDRDTYGRLLELVDAYRQPNMSAMVRLIIDDAHIRMFGEDDEADSDIPATPEAERIS